VHGVRGNNPDQLAIAAQRETDVKQPPRICVSESMQRLISEELCLTSSAISSGSFKKTLLGSCLVHRMPVDAVAAVAFLHCTAPDLAARPSVSFELEWPGRASYSSLL
jgi:hypothetical protein